MSLAACACVGRSTLFNRPGETSRRRARWVTRTASVDATSSPWASRTSRGIRASATATNEPPTPTIPSARVEHERKLLDGARDVVAVDLKELGCSEGPPRMFCPLVEKPSDELPLLVILPGLDGSGFSCARQFEDLAKIFHIECLTVPPESRNSRHELAKVVAASLEFRKKEVDEGREPKRAVYVMGESLGGITALTVALEHHELVDRLILVNPATSFANTIWPIAAPLFQYLPQELYEALPIILSPVLSNPLRMLNLERDGPGPDDLQESIADISEQLVALLTEFQSYLVQVLPKDTLEFRLGYLAKGAAELDDETIRRVQCSTLVIAGEQDILLPSAEEANRLTSLIPKSSKIVLRDASHSTLLEDKVNLAKILQRSGFYDASLKQGFSSSARFQPPSLEEVEDVRRNLRQLRRLVSPVFLSTTEDGRIVSGLDAVPPTDGRSPVLFVGNHQLYAADLFPIVEEFYSVRGHFLRGLAHPFVFSAGAAESGNGARGQNFFRTFGALPVNARNAYRLLAAKEAVLLFPGGVREAYKRKGEEYKLFWPEKPEFVRLAARHGAIIVPFSAIGCDDGFEVLFDSSELKTLPFIGDMVKERLKNIPQARAAGITEELQEEFIAPVGYPRTPNRLYVKFGKPIQTKDVKGEDCEDLYLHVKAEVEEGLKYLLRKREQDPYKDFLPRLLYETTWQGKEAPTFVP